MKQGWHTWNDTATHVQVVKVESEIFDCRVRKMHKVYCRNTGVVFADSERKGTSILITSHVDLGTQLT